MLVRCKECSQVIEVSSLTEHLLNECENRQKFMQCAQCTEAVKIDDFQFHSTHCTGKILFLNFMVFLFFILL